MVRMVGLKLLPVAAEQLHSSRVPAGEDRAPWCPGDRGSSHKVEDIWCVSHPGSWSSTHAKLLGYLCPPGTRSISAPKAFGISLHPASLGAPSHAEPLGCLCTRNLWAVSKHKTFGVSLHLWSISASKTFRAQGPWGISHRNLLGCLTPRALKASRTQNF